MASLMAQLRPDNLSSTLTGTSDRTTVWTHVFLLVLHTIIYCSPNPLNLYAKSHFQNNRISNRNDKISDFADHSNNENVQIYSKTDTFHNETYLESTHAIVATSPITSDPSMMSVQVGKNCATNLSERPNPVEYLTYFNCGHVTKLQNGTTIMKIFNSIAVLIDRREFDPSIDLQRRVLHKLLGVV